MEQNGRTEVIRAPKVLLILGSGFEDLEAVTILAVCGWTEYRDHLPDVRVTVTGFHPEIRGRYGTILRRDIPLDGIDPTDYGAVAIPGGFSGHGYNEVFAPRIYAILRAVHAKGGTLAPLCIGNKVVAKAGLLRGRRATTYPHSHGDNFAALRAAGAIFEDAPIVSDGRIITCRGPGQAIDVGLLILDAVIGPEASAEVQKYMVADKAGRGGVCCKPGATTSSLPPARGAGPVDPTAAETAGDEE